MAGMAGGRRENSEFSRFSKVGRKLSFLKLKRLKCSEDHALSDRQGYTEPLSNKISKSSPVDRPNGVQYRNGTKNDDAKYQKCSKSVEK